MKAQGRAPRCTPRSVALVMVLRAACRQRREKKGSLPPRLQHALPDGRSRAEKEITRRILPRSPGCRNGLFFRSTYSWRS